MLSIKIKGYLLALGAGLMAAFFFALKFISVGKQAAKAETLKAQREIETRAIDNLKKEVGQSNENFKKNERRIANADYSCFNNPD